MNKSQFLSKATPQVVKLEVDGIGEVPFRPIGVRQANAVRDWLVNLSDEAKESEDSVLVYRARMIASCVLDEQGERMFGDDEVDTIIALKPDVFASLYHNALVASDMLPKEVDVEEAPTEETKPKKARSASSKV
jgi:hypothetical protein